MYKPNVFDYFITVHTMKFVRDDKVVDLSSKVRCTGGAFVTKDEESGNVLIIFSNPYMAELVHQIANMFYYDTYLDGHVLMSIGAFGTTEFLVNSTSCSSFRHFEKKYSATPERDIPALDDIENMAKKIIAGDLL